MSGSASPERDVPRDGAADPIRQLLDGLDPQSVGAEMHALVRELFPICRSITGEGLRESLRILKRVTPLVLHEVPTGTPVFDWTIPREWTLRAARLDPVDVVQLGVLPQHAVRTAARLAPVILRESGGSVSTGTKLDGLCSAGRSSGQAGG